MEGNYNYYHKNYMTWSILCTLFCCIAGGVVAIIYSARSNDTFNRAIMCSDPTVKSALILQSEKDNSTAKTWIIASVVVTLFGGIISAILSMTGALSMSGLEAIMDI